MLQIVRLFPVVRFGWIEALLKGGLWSRQTAADEILELHFVGPGSDTISNPSLLVLRSIL